MARFERSKPKFKQQPTVLVICKDKKSGKRYLEDAKAHFRINVLVENCALFANTTENS